MSCFKGHVTACQYLKKKKKKRCGDTDIPYHKTIKEVTHFLTHSKSHVHHAPLLIDEI